MKELPVTFLKLHYSKQVPAQEDAVVELITLVHLCNMFPELEESFHTTFRAAMVENQHLAILVRSFDNYMLYAHSSDPCHNSELKHAMANCFEALMGAFFLDGGTTTGINSVHLSYLFFVEIRCFLQKNIFK